MAYRHLLVPFDGSHLSRAALSLGAWIAWRGGGELDLVKAVPGHPPFSVTPLAGMTDPIEPLTDAKGELSLEALKLREQGVTARGAAFAGEPASVLLDYITRRRIDLIVMGTHGRPEAERWLLGSVASEIARRSPVPVLLIPREAKPAHDDVVRIMVALDGSALAETALDAAVGLSDTVPSAITLFEVLPGVSPTAEEKTPEWYEQPVLGASDYLEQTQGRLAARGVNADCTYSAGEAGDEIVLFANRGAFDVIAIGTRGLTGLPRLVWGSVAERVVRRAHIPVLVTSGSTRSTSRRVAPARTGRKALAATHMRYVG